MEGLCPCGHEPTGSIVPVSELVSSYAITRGPCSIYSKEHDYGPDGQVSERGGWRFFFTPSCPD